MDAMASLNSMIEAKSDMVHLVACKHAYTIQYKAKVKGLFKVVSKQLRDIPEIEFPIEECEAS